MPNCFSLTRKTELDKGPVPLMKIDEEMCAHFGVQCHPTEWHSYWHYIIGFKLAMGRNWDEIRASFCQSKEDWQNEKNEPEERKEAMVKCYEHLLDIANWLEANFTTNAWYQQKSMC